MSMIPYHLAKDAITKMTNSFHISLPTRNIVTISILSDTRSS